MSINLETIFNTLQQNGIKNTVQRKLIVEEFMSLHTHITIDDLLLRVRKKNPQIGYATVYRTLKLLQETGFADERHFIEGKALYEPMSDTHHDHIICTKCNKIVEFENEAIEHLQQQVARANGFTILGHKMEIYGLCSSCQEK